MRGGCDRVRVLGVDPGLRLTGYGCVDWSAGARRPALVEAGVVRLVTRGAALPSVADRLGTLDAEFGALLAELKPEAVAIEGLFSHYKHPSTAVVMAHARGVLMLGARRAGVGIVELKPAAVKKALVGHGNASKRQMQSAIQELFGLAEVPKPPDVADALAIAVCAAHRTVIEG